MGNVWHKIPGLQAFSVWSGGDTQTYAQIYGQMYEYSLPAVCLTWIIVLRTIMIQLFFVL